MKPRKRYAPKLAADGMPQEMGQDVLRACHRWLLDHDTDYRHERLTIETWMEIHHIPPGQLDSAGQRPADTAPKQTSTPSTPSTPKQNG